MTAAFADPSQGWDAVADAFIAARSDMGTALVRSWARGHLAPGSAIVDIGCGSGRPIARALQDDGFAISGIDASPQLIAAFRAALPCAPAACEAAQNSSLFGRHFDAAIAIGLIFLLAPGDQRIVLHRVAAALRPGGRLLFTAPAQPCTWADLLTGRLSQSLGEQQYRLHLTEAGMALVGCATDEGGNTYFDALKSA